MKTNQLTSRAVPVRIEPTFMGIGPNHLAVGLDNSAYFYNISSTEGVRVVSERTYPETVRTIKLNGSYAAAGTVTGRVIFHMIEFDSFNAKVLTLVENEGGHCQVYNQGKLEAQDLPDLVHSYTLREKTFPQSDGRVIDFDLSDSLLSYSTDSRKLYQFHIGEWAIVNTYEHYCPITSLASTKSGCVLAFIDTQHNAYIFNSVSSTLVEVPNSPVGMSRILWNFDDCENPLLMAVSNDFLIIYRYFVASILLSEDECAKQGREVSLFGATLDFSRSFEGTTGNMNLLASEKKTPQIASPQRHILSSRRAAYGQCRLLDRMRLPPNHTPLGFFAEDVCFLTQSGSLAHATLPSHTFRNYTKPYAKNRGAGPDVGLENTSDARGTKQTSYIKLEKIQDEKSKHLDNSVSCWFRCQACQVQP